MSKYIEDSYSSCVIHGFEIEDNPDIEMIRITTVNTNCENMYDFDFEYNWFLDYAGRDLFIELLKREGFYHGDLYEAVRDKYGEYLDKGVIFVDLEINGIPYMKDCYYTQPSTSKYSGFVDYKDKGELDCRLREKRQ